MNKLDAYYNELIGMWSSNPDAMYADVYSYLNRTHNYTTNRGEFTSWYEATRESLTLNAIKSIKEPTEALWWATTLAVLSAMGYSREEVLRVTNTIKVFTAVQTIDGEPPLEVDMSVMHGDLENAFETAFGNISRQNWIEVQEQLDLAEEMQAAAEGRDFVREPIKVSRKYQDSAPTTEHGNKLRGGGPCKFCLDRVFEGETDTWGVVKYLFVKHTRCNCIIETSRD